MSEKRKESHIRKWQDLCAGIALLYMGPTGTADEYIHRIRDAMESENLDSMNHVSALLLSMMRGRGENVDQIQEWWTTLDKDYHAHFCADCKAG